MLAPELRTKWPRIERNLQGGDILLFHKRRGPITSMIRERTHSYWNHSALVFVPRKDLPFSGPLIVEAAGTGIEIHQLKKYTDHFDMYDIAVKRYPRLNSTQRKTFVRNFILSNIDVPYDYSRIVGLYLNNTLRRYFSLNFFLRASRHLVHEDTYVCSTFVHKTFHRFSEKSARGKALSLEAQIKNLEKEELYSPGDIARDQDFSWVFNKRV